MRWFYEHVCWTWVAKQCGQIHYYQCRLWSHFVVLLKSDNVQYTGFNLQQLFKWTWSHFILLLKSNLSDQHFEVVLWTCMLDLSSTIKCGQIHYYQCHLWSHFVVLLKSDNVQYTGFNLQQLFKWTWSHFVLLLKSNLSVQHFEVVLWTCMLDLSSKTVWPNSL